MFYLCKRSSNSYGILLPSDIVVLGPGNQAIVLARSSKRRGSSLPHLLAFITFELHFPTFILTQFLVFCTLSCFSLSTRLCICPTEMRPFYPFLLVASAATVLAQTFEPVDFNVTEALLEQGINVSAIPKLSELAERSSTAGCSIAVSPVTPFSCSNKH